jgi:hypothetical protein
LFAGKTRKPAGYNQAIDLSGTLEQVIDSGIEHPLFQQRPP